MHERNKEEFNSIYQSKSYNAQDIKMLKNLEIIAHEWISGISGAEKNYLLHIDICKYLINIIVCI